MLFVSDKKDEDMELPVMEVKITGRNNLWGKTKEAVVRAFNDFGNETDWILKVFLKSS